MKIRVFAFAAIAFLLSNFASVGSAGPTTKSVKRAKSNQLVAMLPASDAVATFDVKRFFDEALPTLLASNQPLLADVLAKVEKMNTTTGIDIRQFDLVAAGITAEQLAEGKYDVDGVMIARGDVNTAQMISLAKKAAGDKYKEETVNGKTMYVFAAGELVKQKAPAVVDPSKQELAEKVAAKMLKEIAVSAVDANTLAFGGVAKVREALEGKTKVGTDITELLNRKEFAAMNMAGKLPTGLKSFVPVANDELGNSIDSIKYFFGSMDVANGQMAMSVTARTQQISQAKQLYETLDVMQAFGKAALGSSKRTDQQLYARLIEKLVVARSGTEVSMDLVVPQADLDQLMAILTKKK